VEEWDVTLPPAQVSRIWNNLRRRDKNPTFTKSELERWLIDGSHQRKGNIWYCAYGVRCDKPFGISEISLDHRTPMADGGGTTLENLAVCCLRCNRAKGPVGEAEFLALRELVSAWPVKYRKSLYQRLGQPPTRHIDAGRKNRARKRFGPGFKPEFGRRDALYEQKEEF